MSIQISNQKATLVKTKEDSMKGFNYLLAQPGLLWTKTTAQMRTARQRQRTMRQVILSGVILPKSVVLTARLGIQNAQSRLIKRFQNSLKSRGQKSDFVVCQCMES